MVGFFQRYSLLRLFIVFVILIGIRIGASYFGIFQLIPEMKWLLVAERMANGNQLYNTVNTTLEPLSALVYYLIHLIFGKSSTVLFYLSASLVFFQAFLLNVSLNKNKVFRLYYHYIVS